MDQNIKDKEKRIYDQLMKYKKGTYDEKKLAFKCIGILGNESTSESFEKRLNTVDNLINNYKKTR